jgi:hypothetical protein
MPIVEETMTVELACPLKKILEREREKERVMTEPEYNNEQLAHMTELKAVVHDPRYEIVPILGGGDFLYDPQVFWNWSDDGGRSIWGEKEGSILISDIGGQPQRETDYRLGHGPRRDPAT